mmetsp:Transcript_8447/g.20712  ORF Transcript_8447/g.20712 Transcript_8447/m.20712 type:complete len:439 (+) Transcript_8447:770-2086(+)
MESGLLPGSQGNRWRTVDQLQITVRGEFDIDILQCVVGAVDDEQLQHEIELMHLQEGLDVHGVRDARHLLDFGEALLEQRAVILECAARPRADSRLHVELVIVKRIGSRATTLPELPEYDEVIRLAGRPLLGLVLRQCRLIVLNLDLKHTRQRIAALREPLGSQLLGLECFVRQDDCESSEALADADRRVTCRATCGVAPDELEQTRDAVHDAILDARGEDVCAALSLESDLLERQLRQTHGEHSAQEEVAADHQVPQHGLLLGLLPLCVGCCFHAIVDWLIDVLGAICPVSQYHSARDDLDARLLVLLCRVTLSRAILCLRLAVRCFLLLFVRCEEWERRQRVKYGGEAAFDQLRLVRILAHDPQTHTNHTRLLHFRECLDDALHDGRPQCGVVGDQLAHKHDDFCGGGLVSLAQEVHQQMHHRLSHIRETAARRVH